MSAYVEFDLKKFEDNLKELKTKIPNVKFIFPVKCCNTEKVLELVSKYEYGFDISNINEYNIIKKYLMVMKNLIKADLTKIILY